MSWEQDAGAESKQTFLCEMLGIDRDALIEIAIEAKLQILDLEITAESHFNEAVGYEDLELTRLEFEDGRVYEHRRVEVHRGDSWGLDTYKFVELGQEYLCRYINHEYNGAGDTEHIHVVPRQALERETDDET